MIRIKPNFIKIKSSLDGELEPLLAIKGDKGDKGEKGDKGDKGTGATVISTVLLGQDENGGNIYRQTFDDGSASEFVAPKGEKGDAEAVDYLKAYPVGAIYLSANATSPASLFGGTWTEIKDRFLLAAGDTYAAGVTGGSATHTLADSNSPFESLKLFENKKDTAVTGLVGVLWSTTVTVQPHGYVIAKAGEAKDKLGYENPQSGQPVNHMPPYLAVYMWKRTA